MIISLKVTQIGDSLGVMPPEEAVSALHVKAGDELLLTAAPGGFRVTPADPEVRAQIELGREIMRKHYDVLRELAKR